MNPLYKDIHVGNIYKNGIEPPVFSSEYEANFKIIQSFVLNDYSSEEVVTVSCIHTCQKSKEDNSLVLKSVMFLLMA